MICKLCQQDKPLIRKSHLFSNFMYRGIEDERNRMFILSSSNPTSRQTVQSGAYEEYILCQECDNNILSRYERYAANNFYRANHRGNNTNFHQIVNEHGVGLIQCENLDYKNFKLFQLSLLWRASITTHNLFRNFKLSDEDENSLREALLEGNSMEALDFPCIMLTHQNNEEVPTDLVFVKEIRGGKATFYINDFIYTFYIDKEAIDGVVSMTSLNKLNRMAILKAPYGSWTELRESVFQGLAAINHKNA